MKTAVITGASSGIGLSISKMLLKSGYKVYGFGRDFSNINFNDSNFFPIVCDLMDTELLSKKIKEIRKNEHIYVLVNNAGIGYFGLHEELNPEKIHEMVSVNLEVPLILTNILLRDLKKHKGYIINISSITAKESNPHGCAYGSTKAALSHFANSLFDENRKYGVKVVTIHPDMTISNFYRNADFEQGNDLDSYITPEEISAIIENVLNQREGLVIRDITISPQKHVIKRK